MPTQDAIFSVEIRKASLSGAGSRKSTVVQESSKRAFAGYDAAYWGQFEWAEAHWHVFGMLAGRPVSYAEFTLCDAMTDDKRTAILGLVGLGTAPDHQGRGFATKLMAAVREYRGKERAGLGLLVCDSDLVGFYEKCGWREFAGELLVCNHGEELVWPKRSTVLLRDLSHPLPARIDLCGPPF